MEYKAGQRIRFIMKDAAVPVGTEGRILELGASFIRVSVIRG